LTLTPCKPLPQQRQDTLDALDDIQRNPADSLDRISVLREIAQAATRMADSAGTRLMDEWLVIGQAAERILHQGADFDTEVAALAARRAAPEDRSEY